MPEMNNPKKVLSSQTSECLDSSILALGPGGVAAASARCDLLAA